MEELVQNIQRVPKLRKATAWKEPEIMRWVSYSEFTDQLVVINSSVCYSLYLIIFYVCICFISRFLFCLLVKF